MYRSRNSRIRPLTPLFPQKLALTSPTSGGRSVGIVRSRTQATEFFYILIVLYGRDDKENTRGNGPIAPYAFVAAGKCLQSRYLATAVPSGPTISPFRCFRGQREQGDLISLLLFSKIREIDQNLYVKFLILM
jgi:hypothetical protein